ncbi:hypothetical protein ACFUGD_06565 [Streptomyces sp. NPDC057217]|uniref:hypothetical protein n=1 Tax=Streptomyces sp. NPDC057217 TaxID=3346054 RepID=UPI003641CD42
MSTRTITRDQAADWGLPHDLTAADEGPEHGVAAELHREEDTGRRRWASENTLVFRAPDDHRIYRVTYFRGLTETQYDHDVWNDERAVELVEVEPVTVPVVEWRAVGEKPTTTPVPAGDHFTEAAIRRSAYLDAAREADEAAKLFPDNLECAPAIGALDGLAQRLRRLADHYTTNEQPLGPTWEARADHAIRLYAQTAIERDDAQAEFARLRARVAELEQQAAQDTFTARIEAEATAHGPEEVTG